MEPQEEVPTLGVEGPFSVKIVNDCTRTITDVRVTHYLKDNLFTQCFITPSMTAGETSDKVFTSVEGKNDHWTVAFQIGVAGYMAKELDKSKAYDRSAYELHISEKELRFQFVEGGKVKDARSAVTTVYNCVKS